MPRTKPAYPPEFKAEAVRLVGSGDRSLSRLAKDLGVADQTLRNPVRIGYDIPSSTLYVNRSATGCSTPRSTTVRVRRWRRTNARSCASCAARCARCAKSGRS